MATFLDIAKVKCVCGHVVRDHYKERDVYGSWRSNCKKCKCTLFTDEKDAKQM